MEQCYFVEIGNGEWSQRSEDITYTKALKKYEKLVKQIHTECPDFKGEVWLLKRTGNINNIKIIKIITGECFWKKGE